MLRNMTAIFIECRGKILLLERIGSRVFDEPAWVGIGGHFEPEELNDPRHCVLRELWEETGIREEDLSDICLKYIVLRQKKEEIRQNYYFFAKLKNSEWVLPECREGNLAWVTVRELPHKRLPLSTRACLAHYLHGGKEDKRVYVGVGTNGENGADVRITPLMDYED